VFGGAEGVSLDFIDLSGAIKGYATGRPSGDAAPGIAWQLGVDVPSIAGVCGVSRQSATPTTHGA
jgi:hypothetical protein